MPSGGVRPGAGRKPDKLKTRGRNDPRKFLLAVMNDQGANAKHRLDAARYLMPYEHARKGEGGKKDDRKEAAEKAGRGKYATPPTPRLALVKA